MNEGDGLGPQLGLAGIPAAAESADVARALEIALYEGARVHIAHVSCASSRGGHRGGPGSWRRRSPARRRRIIWC